MSGGAAGDALKTWRTDQESGAALDMEESKEVRWRTRGERVIAKLTSKNQLTLPKAVLRGFPATEYFDVTAEAGRLVLQPVTLRRADAVRGKLAELGITEADARAAVAWARKRSRP